MKLFHSLKSQCILLFTLFIIILCSITAFMGARHTIAAASAVFAANGVFITERAASLIDGDAFAALAGTLDPADPYYEEARLKLLALKEYSNCRYLYTIAPGNGTRWRFIIDGSVPPEDRENFSALGDEEDIASYGESFQRAWDLQTTAYSGLVYQQGWGWMVSVYTPVFNSARRPVGIAGCDFDAENLYQAVKSGVIQQGVLALLSLAAGAALMILFLQRLFSRIRAVNLILKEISTGEGDLTKRILIRRNDEIGELASHFNLALDKIKNLVVIIKRRSANMQAVGDALTADMDQTAQAISRITGNIQTVKAKTASQTASVHSANTAIAEVTHTIDALSQNVETQTAGFSQSSAAIEEMLANIQSVTAALIRNGETVAGLNAVSSAGRSGIQGVSQELREIARESEDLLAINGVMKSIASQTNLLSMNAAIEAAHAGEAGRGFAVVAAEIRKLAESSGEQSKIIAQVLKKIKTAIDAITVSAKALMENFQSIEDHVRIVSEQDVNIRRAMEEQGQGSRQVLESLGKLHEITRQVQERSARMLEGGKAVVDASRNLESAAADIAQGVGEISGGAEDINAAADRVSEISGENREHIAALFAEVSRFKVAD
ncbi:MAG: methyl-accepting chemotaxis protein [Treponema sp.]|jgi:methyl-accepting chemotaxis protein|nr:methyl-accepting chemotaxis protein [Treponema sp.]